MKKSCKYETWIDATGLPHWKHFSAVVLNYFDGVVAADVVAFVVVDVVESVFFVLAIRCVDWVDRPCVVRLRLRRCDVFGRRLEGRALEKARPQDSPRSWQRANLKKKRNNVLSYEYLNACLSTLCRCNVSELVTVVIFLLVCWGRPCMKQCCYNFNNVTKYDGITNNIGLNTLRESTLHAMYCWYIALHPTLTFWAPNVQCLQFTNL